MPSKKSATKNASSTHSKKSKQTTPVEVVETVQETQPTNEVIVVEQHTETSAVASMSDSFNDLLTQLTTLRSQITTLSASVRALRSRSEREIKTAQKMGRKRKSANRKPSGFTKPTLISNELATFLNVKPGSEMARTEVTKEINKYIIAHSLKDPKNGRNILADGKLRKLLKLGKSDELTYFNLQKFMSHHFPQSEAQKKKKIAEAEATA